MRHFLAMGALTALLLFAGCSLFQTSRDTSPDDTVIGMVAGTPVTFNELYSQYSRSGVMMDETAIEEGLKEFFPLFMNYRIKLNVAKDAGYFDDPDLLAELDQYEEQSAYPFWIEKEIRDKLLDELYERSQYMLKAQHILISVPDGAPAVDTLNAYNRLMEARERFLNGEDFLALAEEYSSRRQGQSMGGDIGYFSAGWAVKSFEDAAYALNPGEVSTPFRSPFGYHIVHVIDSRKKSADKHFSHIFIQTRQAGRTSVSVANAAKEAYDALESGLEWNDAVRQFTDSEYGRDQGGPIGWVQFGGRFDPAFVDSVMQLEEIGSYSEPFESAYGVHIVRLDSVRQLSESEQRQDLEETLRSLPRFRDNKQAVIAHAQTVGKASLNRDTHAQLEQVFAEHPSDSLHALTLDKSLLSSTFFTFHGQTWTTSDYMEWLQKESQINTGGQYHFDKADDYSEYIVEKGLIDLTRDHFPEFKDLSREYHTGLAVFKVNEDSIWTYAQQDTIRLKELYEKQQDRFQYSKRYRFARFSAPGDSLLHRVQEHVHSGVPVDSIPELFPNVRFRIDVTATLESEPFSNLKGLETGEFSEPFDSGRQRVSLYMIEQLDPRQMTFEEAYNQLVSMYQDIREEEWLESMRSHYHVETYPEAFNNVLSNRP